MQKEKLNTGIDTLIDPDWDFFKTITHRGASLHPSYVTRGEAKFLKAVGQILPEQIMPFVVAQWAGAEGRLLFEKALKDQENCVKK
jgi:hypothetical protein